MPTSPIRYCAVAALSACFLNCTKPKQQPVESWTGVVDTATVQVNGTRIFYEAAGTGSVIVLLHSGNLDRRMWDPQFLALARDHRVIRYDARGYGRSGAADSPYRGDDDLYELLTALHVSRASLVGLSQGGRIAIDFALAHPDMVDRLVLAAPGLSGWVHRYRDTTWLADARRARDRGDSSGIALAWLEQDFMQPAMAQPSVATALRRIAADNGRFWMEFMRYGGEADRQGKSPAFHRTRLIRSPTLLLIGTLDSRDLRELADTLTASIPGLRRVVFENAGHLLNLEQPAKFTSVVRDFLR
jgi:3-oxoadipate enol-lactonase